MAIESWIALVLLVNLAIYTNLGGADFGARYLDLITSGPRADEQRALLTRVIGPSFAVNHVLFLMVAGLVFVAFPVAIDVAMGPLLVPVTLLFASTGLHSTALLVRGLREPRSPLPAGRVIVGVTSVLAALALGMVLAGMASGEIRLDVATRTIRAQPISAWLSPFSLAFGGFLLSLGALAAATRAWVACDPGSLKNLLQRRALRCAIANGGLAFGAFLLSGQGAPYLHEGLSGRWFSLPFEIVTAGAALGAIYALWRGNDVVAGVLVIAQVTLVILGWGLAMQPYLIYPDVTVSEGAGTTRSLTLVLSALVVGAVLLLASFFLPGRGDSETDE